MNSKQSTSSSNKRSAFLTSNKMVTNVLISTAIGLAIIATAVGIGGDNPLTVRILMIAIIIDIGGSISDGVKISERYRTTEQVERAYVEDRDYNFLYQDGEGYHFMNQENYDQITVDKDVIGDMAIWLQEGMQCKLSMFEGVAVALELPARVTLEITDTEPTMKGQTASSSYKPAILTNGARVMVPPHVAAGTRIVVLTDDGSYVERAKD